MDKKVTRCKDCIYHQFDNEYAKDICTGIQPCLFISKESFCSYGRKKI